MYGDMGDFIIIFMSQINKSDMGSVEYNKKCVICNVTFKAKRSDAEVCSDKCRQQNFRRKMNQKAGQNSEYEKLKNEYQSLVLITDSLSKEKFALEAEIARLKPLADSWLLRSAQQKEAAENAPETKITTTSVEVKDLTNPTNKIKPQEQPKTNFSINTTPKTLDELKALCPAELTGLERSEWIRIERQKYGI
jgi:hypothetical protein